MKEKNGYVKWYVFTFVIIIICGVFSFVAKDYYNHKETSWCRFIEMSEDISTIKEAVIWLKDYNPNKSDNTISLNDSSKTADNLIDNLIYIKKSK